MGLYQAVCNHPAQDKSLMINDYISKRHVYYTLIHSIAFHHFEFRYA